MCLFLEAAAAWIALLPTEYILKLGYRKKSYDIRLVFEKANFYHLSGMHYASDVDFKISPNKMYGEKLIDAIISNKINVCDIEKSKKWEKIKGRLEGIVALKNIVESEFSIYKFSPNKLSFKSEISAEYLIHNPKLNLSIFLFLGDTGDYFYCKSIFLEKTRDYTQNQTPYTVLQKIKVENGSSKEIFRHPSYRDKQ